MLNIYRINYENVIQDSSLPVGMRLLASRLIINPTMLVGKYFETISDEELQSLRELTYDTEHSAAELMLLTMMLSAAEGTSALEEEELSDHIRMTVIFIVTTVLERHGYVKAHFDKFSYGPEMAECVIAEKIGDLPDED